jgi:hypothetical protein
MRARLLTKQLNDDSGGVREAYIMFRRPMVKNSRRALYACDERLLQDHREHTALPLDKKNTLIAQRRMRLVCAVTYDVDDGRPYLNDRSMLALISLYCMQRAALVRTLLKNPTTFLLKRRPLQ